MKKLLEKRNKMKSKKPVFMRQDSNKYNFNNRWRRPRGIHNKRRLNKKGHQKNPSLGYGSPKEARYLTKEGYNRVKVNSIQNLDNINKEKEIVVLSSNLGVRKRLEILAKTLEMNIKVENFKDVKKYIESKKLMIEENKKKKNKKLAEKEKSKKELLEKAKEKETKSEEDKEDKQKEIKEEVLGAKQEAKQKPRDINVKRDTGKDKLGHKASSVPGAKQ